MFPLSNKQTCHQNESVRKPKNKIFYFSDPVEAKKAKIIQHLEFWVTIDKKFQQQPT